MPKIGYVYNIPEMIYFCKIKVSTINKSQTATIPACIRNILGVTLDEDIVWLQKNNRIIINSTKKPLTGSVIDVSRIASSGLAAVMSLIRSLSQLCTITRQIFNEL